MKLLSFFLLSISAITTQTTLAEENFFCPNCPPRHPTPKAKPACKVEANEVFTLKTYSQCEPTYKLKFKCVVERGGTFRIPEGTSIEHTPGNSANYPGASWNLPAGNQFIEGSGWLKFYLVDDNAKTYDLDQSIMHISQSLSFRKVQIFNLNNSILFNQHRIFSDGKATCDELAKEYQQNYPN